MEMNKEMLEKAKTAKTVEELKALATDIGIELNDEQAHAYFAQLNKKSGELQDEELDNVAGGACYTDDGRKVTTVANSCAEWQCPYCHTVQRKIQPGLIMNSHLCPAKGSEEILCCCNTCEYISYEDSLWLCNNPVFRR